MLTAIGDVMREAYKRGWISTRDGNISLHRKNSKVLYITPSGVRKPTIQPESVIKMKWQIDETQKKHHVTVSDSDKPSGELEMHELLQRSSNECRAVVHLHPTYIIAAMYSGYSLKNIASLFPEINRYTIVGENVPFKPAISKELAQYTYAYMTNQSQLIESDGGDIDWFKNPTVDICGLDRHGVVAVGPNPWAAFEHIERLEHICQIVLASK